MARLRWLTVFCFAALIAAVAPEDNSRRRVAPFQKEALAKQGKGVKGPPAGKPKPPPGARKPPPPRPKGGKAKPRGKADPRAAWPKPKKPSFGNAFGKGSKGKPPQAQRRRARGPGEAERRRRRARGPGEAGPTKPPPGKGWPRSAQAHAQGPQKRRPVDPKEIEQKKLLEFKFIDADHDGRVTAAEAEAAKVSLNARREKKETLKDWERALRFRMKKDDWLVTADADKDGSLTFEEYKQTMKDREKAQQMQQLQEAQFKLVDADEDGELTVDEVAVAKEALDAKKTKQVEAMKAKQKSSAHRMERFESLLFRRMSKEGWMQAVDANNDGKLTFDEFKVFKKIEPISQEL